MNDGTGKTIEEKRVDLEIERVEADARKKRRHKAIGIKRGKIASDNKKRANWGVFRQ